MLQKNFATAECATCEAEAARAEFFVLKSYSCAQLNMLLHSMSLIKSTSTLGILISHSWEGPRNSPRLNSTLSSLGGNSPVICFHTSPDARRYKIPLSLSAQIRMCHDFILPCAKLLWLNDASRDLFHVKCFPGIN
jgi:hypothetical protein